MSLITGSRSLLTGSCVAYRRYGSSKTKVKTAGARSTWSAIWFMRNAATGYRGWALSRRADVILNEVPANRYRGYRFPEEIISQCVWLYFNLSVSLRDVELMMAYRGIHLSYETIRRWRDTFGTSYAAKLKRRRRDSAICNL
jgi:hypothetical protein